jgi:hypothetical protein
MLRAAEKQSTEIENSIQSQVVLLPETISYRKEMWFPILPSLMAS